jgi:hypothetical protein
MRTDHFHPSLPALAAAAIVLLAVDPTATISPGPNSPSHGWGCMGPCAIIALVLGGAFAAVKAYIERVRSKRAQNVATSLGLTFRREGNVADQSLTVGSRLAQETLRSTVSNVVETPPTAELSLTVFDYAHERRHTKSNHQVKQTVTRMQSGLLHLPKFILFPEGFFERMETALGQADIDFPDTPEFSQRYVLRGDDEPAIRSLFNPILRRALEGQHGITIEGGGELLFIFRAGHRQEPEQVPVKIQQDKAIAALFFEAQRYMNVRPPPLPPPL